MSFKKRLDDEKLIELYKQETANGFVSKQALATKMGVARTTIIDALHRLAREGRLGTGAVLPGFAIKSTSEQRDDDGNVVKSWVKQGPAGETFAVPEGHSVKGVSALVDAQGNTLQQWLKTSKDALDPIAVAEGLKTAFVDWEPSYTPPPPAEGGTDQLTFLPISDLHVGLLSYGRESGEDWDLKIAERVILGTYATLISMTPKTEECVIVFGGDQQHADNFDGMTERGGHVLSVDGRYPKVYYTLCRIAVEIIMLARGRHRNLKVRVLQGNHDRHSAIALAYFLHAWFRNDDFVSVDLSPSLFWFMSYGDNLLCAVHGHTIKARDVAGKIAATQPKRWGDAIFRVCHYFHEHHDEIVLKDDAGLKVEKHAIIAPPDAFAAGGPWVASRNAKSIIYDKKLGEVGRSMVNIVPAHAREKMNG